MNNTCIYLITKCNIYKWGEYKKIFKNYNNKKNNTYLIGVRGLRNALKSDAA
jgi:hypothetical protein